MKKTLLLGLLALSTALPVLAQTPAPTQTPAPVPTSTPVQTPNPVPTAAAAVVPPELRLGQQDTLRAVSKLFESRRKGGRTWTYAALGGVLAMVRVLTAANQSTTVGSGPYAVSTSSSVDAGGVAVVAGLFVGLPVAVGVGKLTRFSEKQEAAVTQAYRNGQPLPKSISRRLSTADFLRVR